MRDSPSGVNTQIAFGITTRFSPKPTVLKYLIPSYPSDRAQPAINRGMKYYGFHHVEVVIELLDVVGCDSNGHLETPRSGSFSTDVSLIDLVEDRYHCGLNWLKPRSWLLAYRLQETDLRVSGKIVADLPVRVTLD